MATGSDTKATQTEEEVEDYLHLREENINFKCAEGIPAKLLKFRAFHEKGFRVRIELNGRLYCGTFLEINESHSFAPVNLITTKRRRPVIYKKNKTRPSGGTRAKNPNTFCRENFPRCFVDAYNTIEARLRYGRDKKIPGCNSFLAPADSTSQSNDNVLKSSRRKKSHGIVEGSASNTDSSIFSVKSNRKEKSRSVVAGSASNMDSSISSANSNRKKRSRSVVTESASNTDSSITSAKNNRTKKSQSVVAGLTSNVDSSISSPKSNRKKRSRSGVVVSVSNMDSSISFAKSNRKKKSRSVTVESVSNSDSSIASVFEHKTKRKYCKRNESDNVSETSNESSSPSLLMFLSNKHNGEKSEISSDTSFSSVSKMTSKKDEKETNFNFLWAMQSQPRDIYPGLGCMVSTPRTNTDALSMNIDDTLRSVASNGSLSQMSESDLISFSPEIDTEKQCQKGHQNVESVSTSPELSEPDLICFSPEVNNETNFKTKVSESPSVIKNAALDLLLSTRSEVSCRSSEIASSQFSLKELVYKPDKIDFHFMENQYNILNTNKKSVNQCTESKLQNFRRLEDGPINLNLSKTTMNEDNNSFESKLQNKSDIDEIHGTNSGLKIKTLKDVNQREKCSESYGEMIGVKSNIYSQGKFNLEFESTEKNTADQKK